MGVSQGDCYCADHQEPYQVLLPLMLAAKWTVSAALQLQTRLAESSPCPVSCLLMLSAMSCERLQCLLWVGDQLCRGARWREAGVGRAQEVPCAGESTLECFRTRTRWM